jgi:hypothetical protein
MLLLGKAAAAKSGLTPNWVLKKSTGDVKTSFRRKPESRLLLIHLESHFWTPAFAGVTNHFSTPC